MARKRTEKQENIPTVANSTIPSYRNPDWHPSTLEEIELLAQIESVPPQDLINDAAKARIAREELDNNEAMHRLPHAYETLPAGSVPTHKLTPWLAELDRMAFQGLKGDTIAARLGMDVVELAAMARMYPDVRLAILGGAARGADRLSAKAVYSGLRGDMDTVRWLLENRHGFVAPREAPSVHINVAGEGVSLSFDRAMELSQAQEAVLALEADDEGAQEVDYVEVSGPIAEGTENLAVNVEKGVDSKSGGG